MRNHQVHIVLGMHRTSTSLVAGGLKKRGVFMGDDMIPANPVNLKGFYESQRFLRLNCDILHAAGGSWKNPPSEQAILNQAEDFQERIIRTLQTAQEKAGDRSWGWKDPRTILTLPLYQPHLTGYDVFYHASFRDPEKIAASLKKWHNISIEDSIILTETYNQRLLDYL